MQSPENDKTNLGIVQSHLVFQIFLISGNSINIDVVFSDTMKVNNY